MRAWAERPGAWLRRDGGRLRHGAGDGRCRSGGEWLGGVCMRGGAVEPTLRDDYDTTWSFVREATAERRTRHHSKGGRLDRRTARAVLQTRGRRCEARRAPGLRSKHLARAKAARRGTAGPLTSRWMLSAARTARDRCSAVGYIRGSSEPEMMSGASRCGCAASSCASQGSGCSRSCAAFT